MTWMPLGHELGVLDAMKNSILWFKENTLGHELNSLDAMNNSGLWLM